MSGTPTELEIQAIWSDCVGMLEKTRVHGDDVLTGAGGEYDTIIQKLEGELIPTDIANAINAHRAGYSALVDPTTVLGFLTPIILEYAQILAADATLGFGSAYADVGDMMTALYEWFVDKSLTVQSRGIAYDTTATAGGSNVGNGDIQRLTVDQNGFDLEACHVEAKTFRCRADKTSGVTECRETFEHLGTQGSFDALQRAAFGSGESARAFVRNHHAGTGAGGSKLRNASFSTYDATATPVFDGWDLISGTALTQDGTNYYIGSPGSTTPYGAAAPSTFKIRQTLANMRLTNLDPNTPYFCRLMFQRFNSADGTLTIRCGSVSESVTLSAQTGWNELRIGTTTPKDQWLRNFNEDGFDIEIEWSGRTAGDIVIDDILFGEYDLIDGTWWFLRHSASTPVSWLLDDTLRFTDTGGAPATGKIQWYLFVAGLGYLPSSGTPSFSDP